MSTVQIDKRIVYNAAVSVLDVLQEESQKKVLDYSIGLLKDDVANPFKPVTKEQVLKDLDQSDADIKAGRVQDAHQAMNEIRSRLGITK